MPNVSRAQVLEQLGAWCPADELSAAYASALAGAGLDDRPMFRPEEVSRIAQAVLLQARQQLADVRF